jgi:hypothetical protein
VSRSEPASASERSTVCTTANRLEVPANELVRDSRVTAVPLPEQRRRSTPAVSAKACASFLEALSVGGSVTHAAKRAGVARQRFYEQREADGAFASTWDEALAQGTEALEDEARRRAAEGWEEPIYQRGELVGHVRKYSDNLLIFLLKARDPARFRESVQVNAGGEVTFVLDSLLARARGLPPATDVELGPGDVAEDDPGAVGR